MEVIYAKALVRLVGIHELAQLGIHFQLEEQHGTILTLNIHIDVDADVSVFF